MKQHEIASYALLVGLLLSVAPALTRQATAQTACDTGQELITIPEIKSEKGLLRAEITLTSGQRTLWGSAGAKRCDLQPLRYFTGRTLLPPGLPPGPADPAFARGEPIPGPTLRARVGDLIQIKFLNHVDTKAFPNSLDQDANPGNTTGCDEVTSAEKGLIYPNPTGGGTIGDVMPNCLHGSSTSNLHFHGTHTTPDTTGDNITLFVLPALRSGPDRKTIEPDDVLVKETFNQIFEACAKEDTPSRWEQLPKEWRDAQERLLKQYDTTTPYRGHAGPLPLGSQLWLANQQQINSTPPVWPQNQIGAYPYCFRLADTAKGDIMGQAPGTHWYHAHKHGSTALNVANGMTGAFVIEGQYDDDLRKFYGPDFRDQVLVIQQLSSTPFPLLNPVPPRDPTRKGRNDPFAKPQLSVNGRLNPVVKMRPGEVQLWRLVNGAFRDAVQLQSFAPQKDAPPDGPAWRQIAQDGVQLDYANYGTLGVVNRKINLAPANRVDLLVKAPGKEGKYDLMVQPNAGLPYDDPGLKLPPLITLLTVIVEGTVFNPRTECPVSEGSPVSERTDCGNFIQKESDFPKLPNFLKDIPATEINKQREITFGAQHNLIDGKTFNPQVYSQVMTLNSAEEWKISNEANDKAHPFHIHVNPFQITEVFEPNAPLLDEKGQPKLDEKGQPVPLYIFSGTPQTGQCLLDPTKPETWKPCTPIPAPYVWWDTFAIPTSRGIQKAEYDVTKGCQGAVNRCPQAMQPYVKCSTAQDDTKKWVTTCTETIPGYFKMRSRFVDFTGTYVLHCHILIHEDRGMMQLVHVSDDKKASVPDKPPYAHH